MHRLTILKNLLVFFLTIINHETFSYAKDIKLNDPHGIIMALFKSIDNIKTLTYKLILTEQVEEGKVHSDSSQVKYQKKPNRIYIKMSDGTEVFWLPKINKGKAEIHTGFFPYITVKLDPEGKTMRKKQHHDIDATGFDYFENILKQSVIRAGKNFNLHFLFLGETVFENANCYKIGILNPSFKYVPYSVLKGETVLTIARKLRLSEYLIMEENKLSSYNEIKAGQTLMIPNYYGKEMFLYIDKATMLPRLIRVDTDKGLFEQYIFRNLKVNPFIDQDEFLEKK